MALPFDVLVLLAGLASLPSEPLESARVDGASPWQLLIHVMLPLLKPVIALIFVVRLADAFRIFDVVYVLTGGGPANATDVLSTYIYRQMFTALDFPGGAAASVLLVLVTTAFSILAVLLLRTGAWRRDESRRSSLAPSRRRRLYGFLAVVCVLILVPIYWIVATSVQADQRDPGDADQLPHHASDARALSNRAERRFPALSRQQHDRGERIDGTRLPVVGAGRVGLCQACLSRLRDAALGSRSSRACSAGSRWRSPSSSSSARSA
jgi:ABC-type Fe3+ transport system permease subunit